MSDTRSSRLSSNASGTRRTRRRNTDTFGKDILPADRPSERQPMPDPRRSHSEESLEEQEPLSLAEEIAEEGGMLLLRAS